MMENQNSVAYVGKVGAPTEIPGADNIELVMVNGWMSITKKGDYKEGDLVEIHEIAPLSRTKTWVVTRLVEAARVI